MKLTLTQTMLAYLALVVLLCWLVAGAEAQGLKSEDAPELKGEFCQQCYNGLCIDVRCPNTKGSPIINAIGPIPNGKIKECVKWRDPMANTRCEKWVEYETYLKFNARGELEK